MKLYVMTPHKNQPSKMVCNIDGGGGGGGGQGERLCWETVGAGASYYM